MIAEGAGRLAGKVAVVTGAARGQGEREARRFVAEGARVVLTDIAVSIMPGCTATSSVVPMRERGTIRALAGSGPPGSRSRPSPA